jgi:hypothetical protein
MNNKQREAKATRWPTIVLMLVCVITLGALVVTLFAK